MKYTISIILLLISIRISSQDIRQIPVEKTYQHKSVFSRCGLLKEISNFEKDPKYKARIKKFQKKYRSYLEKNDLIPKDLNNRISSGLKSATVYFTIPVVFHLIGNTTIDKVNYSKIEQQIDILNQNFRNNVASPSSLSVDTGIEFCLYNNEITSFNGVETYPIPHQPVYPELNTLVYANENFNGNYSNKNFLNVYVMELVMTSNNINFSPSAAITVLPTDSENYPVDIDGIVIDPDYFGPSTDSYNGQGKVLVHDIGHWLGLQHTFHPEGNCIDNDPYSDGDYIADTPVQMNSSLHCPQNINSCNIFNVDHVQNYMDYSNDQCRNAFTFGQSTMMHYILGSKRTHLNGCLTPAIIHQNPNDTVNSVDYGFSTRSYFIKRMKITKEKDTNMLTGDDDVHYQSAEIPLDQCSVQNWGLEKYVEDFGELNVWHSFETYFTSQDVADEVQFLGSPTPFETLKVILYDHDNQGTQSYPICQGINFEYSGRNSAYGIFEIDPRSFNIPNEERTFTIDGAVIEVVCR